VHAYKHLFVGRENRPTLIIQFQLFAVASRDGFLGNTKRRRAYHRDERNRDIATVVGTLLAVTLRFALPAPFAGIVDVNERLNTNWSSQTALTISFFSP
jgi:hypothetical protein